MESSHALAIHFNGAVCRRTSGYIALRMSNGQAYFIPCASIDKRVCKFLKEKKRGGISKQ